MKRTTVIATILAILLVLAGCAAEEQTRPAAADGTAAERTEEERQTPAAVEPEPEPEPEPEAAWHYEVKTENVKDKYEDGGVVLAKTDNDYPVLELVCDGGDGKQPPEEMQTVADAFNRGSWGYMLELDSAYELGVSALEQYNGTDAAYRQYFSPYSDITEICSTYEHGELLDVQIFHSVYWGGAHGAEDFRNFHFDLKTGEFFELSDLTDTPEKLRSAIAGDIIDGIFERGEERAYFDGFAQTIKEREEYNVSFGEDGISVIFSEYEIAPYASGMPEFSVPYEKIARFLNERGRRLLDLPPETFVLGDYYDALELWYWFEGSVPLDYDDTREGTITNEYGTYEMPYLRVDEPGIRTLADLRARLLTRFSERLVDERMNETSLAMFQEFDGVLYAAAAGRGTDITVESVDCEVRFNASKDGGDILANIHRRDYDEKAEKWYSTGVVDQVPIPFVMGENGAVFDWFPTIW